MVYNCCLGYDSFIFYLEMKKINLAVTGCMGRMGQQLIKSSNKNKKHPHMLKISADKYMHLARGPRKKDGAR